MMILALIAWLFAAPPAVQDTFPETFDWKAPVKAWNDSSQTFAQGQGHWSLVLFFSPNCGHCHKAWPVVEQWNKRYGSRGIQFRAVGSGYATRDDMDWFEKTNGPLQWPVFHDTGKTLGDVMKVRSLPTFFLVAPDGSYRRWVGNLPGNLSEIESLMGRMLRWRKSGF